MWRDWNAVTVAEERGPHSSSPPCCELVDPKVLSGVNSSTEAYARLYEWLDAPAHPHPHSQGSLWGQKAWLQVFGHLRFYFMPTAGMGGGGGHQVAPAQGNGGFCILWNGIKTRVCWGFLRAGKFPVSSIELQSPY